MQRRTVESSSPGPFRQLLVKSNDAMAVVEGELCLFGLVNLVDALQKKIIQEVEKLA